MAKAVATLRWSTEMETPQSPLTIDERSQCFERALTV